MSDEAAAQEEQSGGVPTLHESLTAERVCDAVERGMYGRDMPGLCVDCGAERGGCEPDAERYKCHSCGRRSVYGAETVLMFL